MSSTYFGLLAEFGTAEIPLSTICEKFFGLAPEVAKKRAALHRLPVPVYRAGSQKSGWLVSAIDLAQFIDDQKSRARKEWEKARSGLES